MGIQEDYQQALSLAKQGKYHAARNMLIAYDTPEANALLARIENAIREPKPTDWGNILAWGAIVLFVCGVISFCSVYWVFINTDIL